MSTAPFDGRGLPMETRPPIASKQTAVDPDPVAAGKTRNTRVLTGPHAVLYWLLTAVCVGVLTWQAWLWSDTPAWQQHPGLTAVLAAILGLAVADRVGPWALLPLMRRTQTAPPKPGLRVAVATTFVPSGEPLDMLEKTVAALVALDYPHDTFVLDEGDDEAVKALCQRLGARHFTRRHLTRREESAFDKASKSGNCNAFFEHEVYGRYDIVVTFDPDHVPEPRFLPLALGPFADPKVAYVQFPQAYSNTDRSMLARGAAEETFAYHSAVQMANHRLGYPTIVGCHNAHRVTALQEVGGYGNHEADDLLTTARYQATGWRGHYEPTIAARGLVPEDWASYLRQQRRWTRSMLDVKLHHLPVLMGKMGPSGRFLALAQGLSFLYRAAVLPVVALITVVLLVTGAPLPVLAWDSMPAWGTLFLALCSMEWFIQRYYLDPAERGVPWRRALLQFAKWPYSVLAIADAARGFRPTAYVLTPKTRGTSMVRGLWLTQLATGLVMLTAVAFALGRGIAISPMTGLSALIFIVASAMVLTSARGD